MRSVMEELQYQVMFYPAWPPHRFLALAILEHGQDKNTSQFKSAIENGWKQTVTQDQVNDWYGTTKRMLKDLSDEIKELRPQ